MAQAAGNSDTVSVSIIVPVYNAAQHLEECLQSITRQDFSGAYEVIIVDDCSSDTSRDICRDWMQRQQQASRLIEHERNRGVSVARNHGLDAASGKYCLFVDADDVLPGDALSALVEAAASAGVDIVKGNNTIFDDSRETVARYNVDNSMVIEGEAVLATLLEHDKLRGHPWGKLFNRQKLGDTRFPEGVRVSEDLVFCSEAFSRASSLLLLNRTVYRYRSNQGGSAAGKYQTGAYIDWLDAVGEIARFCRSRAQRRAHRDLLVRTLTQIARESRALSSRYATPVVAEIDRRRRQWGIGWIALLASGNLNPAALGRLLKMYLALYRIRRNLSAS